MQQIYKIKTDNLQGRKFQWNIALLKIKYVFVKCIQINWIRVNLDTDKTKVEKISF